MKIHLNMRNHFRTSEVYINGSSNDKISHRIAKATCGSGKTLSKFWNERGLNSIYHAVVRATLLYASELWIPYIIHIIKLVSFRKRCLRTIYRYL